jgi:hypothetical protein
VLIVQHVRLHDTCPIGQALRPGGRHRDYPVVVASWLPVGKCRCYRPLTAA